MEKLEFIATDGRKETRIEALSAWPIILNKNLTDGFTDEPARKHKRKRIQKKWLKRYGYKPKINENIYVTQDAAYIAGDRQVPVKTIIIHPATFRKFVKAFGSEDEAAKGISKYFTEVTG